MVGVGMGLALLALVHRCASAVYHLKESEYDRKPPLSALDEYERCLRARSVYCVARLDLVAGPGAAVGADHDLLQLIQEYSAYSKKHFNHSYIERGVCIMETCREFAVHSDDMSAVVEACVNDTIWKEYRLQAKMSQLFYCDDPTSHTNIDWLDWTVASVFIILLVLNFAGTLYEAQMSTDDGQSSAVTNYLLSFSVIRNWRWLVSQPDSDDHQRYSLKALYGAKAFSTMLTIIMHTLFLFVGGFTDNPYYYEKAFNNPLLFLLVNGLTVVQIFFVISGFLLVYNLQIASESRPITWSLLPKILIMRWCRLTPSYALTIAFTATWLRHLSSGVLWNMYVTQASSQCRQLWWKHLLYIQNYEPGDHLNLCSVQAWHVAVDTQLFVVGLVVCMMSSARARYLGIMLMLAVGLVSPALYVWLQGLDPMTLITPEFFRALSNRTFQQLHIRPENNSTCYAIGMLVGYVVCSWRKQDVDLSKYRIFRYLNLLIVPAFCLVFYSGHIFYEPEPVPFAVGILYAMLLRVVLGIIVAYAIITFVFKAEETVRGFFEWRGFVPLARLSYAVYLLHVNVILVLGGQRTQLQHASVFNMVVTYLGVTTLTFLIAVPYYLLVEAPIDRLLKALISPKKQEAQEKKTM